MPSPPDIPPGTNASNNTNGIDTNKAMDTHTPTPATIPSLSCRRHGPSLSLSIHEQDGIFHRISTSQSATLARAADKLNGNAPAGMEGLATSPGLHILHCAWIREYIESYTSAKERHGQRREGTRWGVGVGVPVPGTHPLSFSLSLSTDFQHAGIIPTGRPGETLPGTFMITDEHRSEHSGDRERDNDHLGSDGEEEDEILFTRPSPKHTRSDGGSDSDSDSDSDGGAPLSGPSEDGDSMDENDGDDSDGGAPLSALSENGTPGNDRAEDNRNKRSDVPNPGHPGHVATTHHQQFQHGRRAKSDRKADAQLTQRRRPDTPIPVSRSGIETGAQSDAGAGADTTPELFSTLFRLQRAEARMRMQVLNRFSPSDHPDTIDRFKDAGQQTNDIEQQHSQHNIPDKQRTADFNTNPFNFNRHHRHHVAKPSLASSISKSLQFPLPTPKLPSTSSSSRSVLAQSSSTLSPRALLLYKYEPQGNRTTTNQVPKPPTPTTTTTTTGDTTTRDTTPSSSTPGALSFSQPKLGPFPLSPSTLALLDSSQASLKRLTTPKFHPAFSRSRQSQNQEAQTQGQASTAAWTSIDIADKKTKEAAAEEEGWEDEDWEWVDNPCDEFRIWHNPGRAGYARNGGFGRREEGVDELPGGLPEEVGVDYGFVLDRNGNGTGGGSGGGLQQQQHQHRHRHQTPIPIPVPIPPLHRGITRSGISSTSTRQTQPHLAASRLRQLQQAQSNMSTSLSGPSSYTLSRPSVSSSSASPEGHGEVGVGVAGSEQNQEQNEEQKGKNKGKDKGKGKATEVVERHDGTGREVAAAQLARARDQGQGSNSTSTDHRNQERGRGGGDRTRVDIRMGQIVQPTGRLEEGRREDSRGGTHTGSVAQPSGRSGLEDNVDIDEWFADVRPGRVGKRQ